MKVILTGLFILAGSIQFIYPQDNIIIPPGYSLTNYQHFTVTSLYGHINGGAELFLEYGFNSLDYYLLEKEEQYYRIDIYRMSDPQAAYGIFSIKKYNCFEDQMVLSYSCHTPYQVSLVCSEIYITIANDEGNSETSKELLEIGKHIAEKYPVSCINIPLFSDIFQFENGLQTKLFRGKLSFENGLPDWEQFFEGYKDYTCFYQEAEWEDKPVEMLRVEFSDNGLAGEFLNSKLKSLPEVSIDMGIKWHMEQEGNVVIVGKGNISLLQKN